MRPSPVTAFFIHPFLGGAMSDGPWRRTVDRLKEKAPRLHRFLTDERYGSWRSLLSLVLILGLGVTFLWGLTGQSLGEAPVVVIESGSMMHCGPGSGTAPADCQSTAPGRLGTIDPGDLVFVKDTGGADTISTFAADGKERFGKPGDVIVYDRGGNQPPIIHRAMFWIELHGDGTYSIPELGIDHSRDLDPPALVSQEARDRFGLGAGCQLFDSHTRRNILQVEGAGFITKGDNHVSNGCWDQGGGIYNLPVVPEQVIGKARGEVPWIGLLKLLVFDLLGNSNNYANAPRDLKTLMWVSVSALVLVPYGAELALKRRRDRGGEPGPEE